MNQPGMAERRLSQLHGKATRLHCSALETPAAQRSCPVLATTAAGNLGLLRQRNRQGSSPKKRAGQILFHKH